MALLCTCPRALNPGFLPVRCPHCQHFQPEYEKVAAFFHERGEQEPVVQVARLDCAEFVSLPAPARHCRLLSLQPSSAAGAAI